MTWTLEERLKIKEFIKQGLSGNQMSLLLNRPVYAIHKEFARGGFKENYDPYLADSRSPKKKAGEQHKLFTTEERVKLSEMLQKSYTFQQIANELGRNRGTIQKHVYLFGGRFDYDPFAPYRKAYHSKASPTFLTLYNEVQALKMQMEIVLDFIESQE